MHPGIEQRRSDLLARCPRWVPRTLDQALEETAAEFGDRPLVLTDERTLTYSEAAASASVPATGSGC
jgi:fatty-acyl-CoA synthase